MHAENAELFNVVGQIYDAALQPALWPGVLNHLCLFLEMKQTAVVLEDAADPTRSLLINSFEDTEWLNRYLRSYMLINPMRLAMVRSVAPGDVVLTSDFMTPAEYQRTPFATEFLAPRGVVDIAAAVIDKTATTISVLSAHRGVAQGFADETVREKLRLLLPHVQRAVKIGEFLERRTVEAATLVETLDKVTAAVLLVDEIGTILHANSGADRMLATADVAQVRANRLVLHDKAAAQALANALAAVARGAALPGADANGTALRGQGGGAYIVSLMPLTQGRRAPIGSAYRAVAALCIKPWTVEAAVGPVMMSRFDLTRREAAILTAAIEIGGVAEIAASMGVSAATVKTHLKSIYRKTGVSRHADLVKLVAAAEMPLR